MQLKKQEFLRTKDFNTGDNFGIGYFQFTTSRNKLLKLKM